jgi:uncharacterized protein (TIGR00730 family)
MSNKRITVFCGASLGNDDQYVQLAKEIGRWIAQSGYELVYGGARVGLMGVVADAVLQQAGKVYGVIPQMLVDRGASHQSITNIEIVPDMDVRKKRMMELGDVLIALPGGPGTLEEMAEAFSWARLGLNDKPSIYLDVDGYWQPVKEIYQRMVTKGFLTQNDYDKLYFVRSFEEINQIMASYIPPAVRTYPKKETKVD